MCSALYEKENVFCMEMFTAQAVHTATMFFMLRNLSKWWFLDRRDKPRGLRSLILAILVGITERELGVGTLGWHKNFTGFDGKETFFFSILHNERKNWD